MPGRRGVQINPGVWYGHGKIIGSGVAQEQGLKCGRTTLVGLEEHQMAARATKGVSWLCRPSTRLLPVANSGNKLVTAIVGGMGGIETVKLR